MRSSISKRQRKKRSKERNREKHAALLKEWRNNSSPIRRRRLVGIRGRNLLLKIDFDPETEIRYSSEDPVRSGDGVIAEIRELSERQESLYQLG